MGPPELPWLMAVFVCTSCTSCEAVPTTRLVLIALTMPSVTVISSTPAASCPVSMSAPPGKPSAHTARPVSKLLVRSARPGTFRGAAVSSTARSAPGAVAFTVAGTAASCERYISNSLQPSITW